MSIMEGDEGWTNKNIKNCSYFQKRRQKREGQRIHGNSYKFRERRILKKNIEKYYSFSVEKI